MSSIEELARALDGAVGRVMDDGTVALLFSGGLDSGVLAALARRHGRPMLYTVGVDGCHDLRAAEDAAAALDLPWTPLVMSPDEVIAACREMLSITGIGSPLVLSFELPLQMVASRASERMMMSGQGADEMFGGYSRYLQMGPVELEASMRADLAKVLTDGVPLDRTIAARYGKGIVHPFLDQEVRDVVHGIPASGMIRGGVRKAPLREVALSVGAAAVAGREKKAAQYGSGFMKVMKAEARRHGQSLGDYVATLRPGQHR